MDHPLELTSRAEATHFWGDHSEAWQEVRRYTPATARRLVEAAGLRAERVSFVFASLSPLIVVVRFAQRLS